MTETSHWHSPAALIRLIDEHLGRYPEMEARDVYKLLYQGTMGMGHLVRSPGDFAVRLQTEYEAVSPRHAEPLWETIHPEDAIGRLNLRPFKAQEGNIESLIAACLETAEGTWGTLADLSTAWATFVKLARAGRWQRFPPTEVQSLSAWLEAHSYPVVHHSTRYVEAYRPAYRLLDRRLLADLAPPGNG
jgi:hypothetical protein